MRDAARNGDSGGDGASAPGAMALLVGASPAAAALLYRLLCLHPQTAYLIRLESTLPWLPAALTGRLRLRRHASKLRWWFRDGAAEPRLLRTLAAQLAPAEASRVYRLPSGEPAASGEASAQRAIERLRARLHRQRQAGGARLMICHCGTDPARAARLADIFPEARVVEVLGGPGRPDGSMRAAPGSRPLEALPAPRRRVARYDDLIEAPIEPMRGLLEFLGLERRPDYEWALKTLKLAQPAQRWRTSATRDDRAAALGPAALESGEPLAPSGYPS